MTRQQRRSKSQYLNAARKMGYRPSKGYVYRRGQWHRRRVRYAWRLPASAAFGEMLIQAYAADWLPPAIRTYRGESPPAGVV